MNDKIKPLLEDSIFLKISKMIPYEIKTTNSFGTEQIQQFIKKTQEIEVDTFYFNFLDVNNREQLIELYEHNIGLVILDKEFFTSKQYSLIKKAFFNNFNIKFGFPLELFDIYGIKDKIALLFSKVQNGGIKKQSFKFESSKDIIFNIKITEENGFDIIEEIIKKTFGSTANSRSFNGLNLRNSTICYDAYENKFISATKLYSHKNDRFLNLVLEKPVESEKKLCEELNLIVHEVYNKFYPFVGEKVTVNGRTFRYGKRFGLAIYGIYVNRKIYEELIA